MKNAKNAVLSTKMQSAPLYAISHPDRVIHFVATPKDWTYCDERLRAATIVGIDSETRPVFHAKQKSNPCSLLQLAVRCAKGKSEVFVLDLLKLQPKIYNSTLAKLFLSKQVIKLGQGLLGDLKDLVASYPAASCFSVAKGVVEVNDMSICLAGAHHAISLQKLAFFYLNKRLTKTMQTSNWNRRPLSNSQLHYAASDALVLIEIYDELLARLYVITQGTFSIESVMLVLDVHVEPTPKCTLCFEPFETIAMAKLHRKECVKGVRSLALCVTCDEMKLLDAEAMKDHVATCGNPSTIEELIQSPVEVSDLVVATNNCKPVVSVKAAPPKKRNRADSGGRAQAAQGKQQVQPAATSATGSDAPSKRTKKNKKSKTKETDRHLQKQPAPPPPPPSSARPKRKMSAGTLLQADEIWSELSMDLSRDDQGTP